MSQSWDNLASMHDHLYMPTKHRDIVHAQTVSCLGKIVHQYRAHAQMKVVAEATPLGNASKCAMATFSLCSNVATVVPDY